MEDLSEHIRKLFAAKFLYLNCQKTQNTINHMPRRKVLSEMMNALELALGSQGKIGKISLFSNSILFHIMRT